MQKNSQGNCHLNEIVLNYKLSLINLVKAKQTESYNQLNYYDFYDNCCGKNVYILSSSFLNIFR